MDPIGSDGRPRVARAALILTAVMLASRVWFILHRYLDLDEFEHAHATWSVSRGLVPYVDFFEHHTPWLYFLFAPLFPHFATDTDPHAAVSLLVVLRLLMWGISIASVVCVYELGRLWRDRETGMLAAFLFTAASQFQDVMFEYRPDVPALLCLLLCLIAVVRAWRSDRASVAGALFSLGGLAFGAAVLFTQKSVLALPGLAVALLAYVGEPGAGRIERWRLRAILVSLFVAGAAAPVAWTMYWFDAHGALTALVHHNVGVNIAQNAGRFSPLPRLFSHLIHSPALMVLGFGGFVVSAMRAKVEAAGSRLVLLGTAASLFVGVGVIPRVYDQYLVAYFPHLSVFAASWTLDLVSRVGPRLHARAWCGPVLVLAPLASLVALVVGVDDPASVAGAAMIVSFTLAAVLAAAGVSLWQHA
ncbi:MAG: glycosyltransferase family 39 protein, partial [Vicinamibacterales bacterium]